MQPSSVIVIERVLTSREFRVRIAESVMHL